METIHGAELVVLSFPEQPQGEYVGGLFTIATPMGKNWHWLRAEDDATVDAMLVSAWNAPWSKHTWSQARTTRK